MKPSYYLTIVRQMLQSKHNQWKSQSELESLQEEKLRETTAYAAENVRHYRDHKPIRDIDDLPLLPITKKLDIKRDPDAFISREFKKQSLTPIPTSGSTGVPLVPYFSKNELAIGQAMGLHIMTEAGLGPFDRRASVSYRRANPRFLSNILYRNTNIQMVDEISTLRAIAELKADVLVSYPSFLELLAHANLCYGLKIGKVFSFSEVLHPKTRELITRSFGSDVRNLYGTNEMYSIAWECEEGKMHINSDSLILEVVDERGHPVKKGEKGRILLTSLYRRSMPFIRYEIEDLGSLGTKCRCGRGLHILKSLEGRSNYFLFDAEGKIFSAEMILPAVKKLEGVLQCQMVQREPGRLILNVIPDGKVDREKVRKTLQDQCPKKLDIEVELVDKLPRGRTGKLKAVISEVQQDI